MPILPDFALGISAIAFAGMGLGALAAPDRVTGQFDIPTLSANGRNEVRAVYGGFGAAMALILLATLFHPTLRLGVCLTLAAALGGMAAGRLISAMLDRKLGRAPLFYIAVELVGAALLLYAA
jgi:hypothetical protein